MLHTEGTYCNIKKTIYAKPTANIILKGENQEQECPLTSLLFNIILEVLGTTIRRKRNKRNPNGKGR